MVAPRAIRPIAAPRRGVQFAAAYAAAKENGMAVYEPTAEEIAAWKAAAAPVYDGYRDAAGDMGAKMLEAAEAF